MLAYTSNGCRVDGVLTVTITAWEKNGRLGGDK